MTDGVGPRYVSVFPLLLQLATSTDTVEATIGAMASEKHLFRRAPPAAPACTRRPMGG